MALLRKTPTDGQTRTKGNQGGSARSAKRTRRGALSSIGALLAIVGMATSALAYASTTGWTDGRGRAVGIGPGLVLEEFFSFGDNAVWRQKWAGAFDPAVISGNEPAGMNTDLWCIESGPGLTTNNIYSWSTDSNARARYLMWLSEHGWDSPDERAAIQWLLYAVAYPSMGSNNTGGTFDYESRVWNHADFTTAAKNTANAFLGLSTSQMHNTAARLHAVSNGGAPTTGDLQDIGVLDGWGNYIAGLPYTITITGPAVFDGTGTNTVTGTTTSTLITSAHEWTATASGDLDFVITYQGANVGSVVYVGADSTDQDVMGGAGFSNLTSSDPTVDAEFMFQPGGTTQVASSSVAPGDTLADTFTPSALNGTTWPIDSGAYVPATFDWAVYDTGEVIPGSSVATEPAAWTLLETIQVTATAPTTPINSTFTTTAVAGHGYAFVVSFTEADQPEAYRGWFVGDWSDEFGMEDEISFAPTTPSASTTASSVDRGSDTVVLDEVTLTGFPSDHGTFTGAGVFAADERTVQQRLYFFPETLAVSDANTATAELMCDLTVPATNGVHQVDDTCATVKRDAWDQAEAGTYAWTTEFAGDARSAAFATSVTEPSEQVSYTNEPLATSTIAHGSTPLPVDGSTALRAAGSTALRMDEWADVWDTAEVTGYVPVGSTIEFSLYEFADRDVPVCDVTTLVTTVGAVEAFVGAGQYTSERVTMLMPDADGLGWVETVSDASGNVLTAGVCGTVTETLAIDRSDNTGGGSGGGLARTGADSEGLAVTGGAGAMLTLLGAGLVLVGRRRLTVGSIEAE